MAFKPLLCATFCACLFTAQSVLADESPTRLSGPESSAPGEGDGVQKLIGRALGLIGIRYRAGGNSSETGFDCSGFVGHVFRETLGLVLPRTAHEISRKGAPVDRGELAPGDLVFFHTLRRAFSHVGIYLGDNQFVHAPRPGQKVRIADMSESYWATRYDGARRVSGGD